MSLLLLAALLGCVLLLTRATPADLVARALTGSVWLLTGAFALADLDLHLPRVLSRFLENSVAADLSVVIALGTGAVWLLSRPPAIVAVLLALAGAGWVRTRRSQGAR